MHAGLADSDAWCLLIPGFTGSKEDFIAVVPRLAQAGVGAVAFDQLGQYQSDASDVSGDYALDLLAADAAAVAAVVQARFARTDAPHLLGHSFGGLVAQEAVASAVLRPASLVLLCSGPGALPGPRRAALPDLVAALELHDLATIWRIMHEMEEAEDVVPPPPAVAAFLEDRWHANSPVQLRELALHLLHARDQTARVRSALDGIPAVVMWGEHDDAWPVADQIGMARDLGATAVELPGLGHSPNAQDPDATVEALIAAWGRTEAADA